ncbi:uracil-DNA glycosylase [Sinanaerobacter sp. ZZT-01]|uniref:uracil-DNA glycosylase n=1 Tax=Sinanaerobacter sp. ZZT-01 TaxID=3111540 RepID=UPI002D766936|nr:uracil-DNA glycosylase [Sinanaerobacter sp. ZZT-01]WRR92251.1 uracil-DNA glycosylase [Sinanaerobacter sp. ZZT-01]
MVNTGNDWNEVLKDEFDKPYYQELRKFLISEYRSRKIYPSMYDIFNALKHTAYADTKVVILGQDPYHGPGQAHGMCFSVQKGVKKPPSLINIFKELDSDLGIKPPSHGNLESWADQGVLLLNTVLTVRSGEPNSHKGRGWETFTDHVISMLDKRQKPMVFMLWGANAKSKQSLIQNKKHLILTASHPSPLSAHNGWWGCSHFSKANDFLRDRGENYINWAIED